jgi:hypothetical protein
MPYLGIPGKVPQEKAGAAVMNMEMLVGSLVGNSPLLVFWIAVLIFGIVLLKRGGGRAERFLIAGAGVKLAAVILGIPLTNITFWLIREGYSVAYRDSVATGYSVFLDILGMAGVICLIYAFWVKFKATESDREIALLKN